MLTATILRLWAQIRIRQKQKLNIIETGEFAFFIETKEFSKWLKSIVKKKKKFLNKSALACSNVGAQILHLFWNIIDF